LAARDVRLAGRRRFYRHVDVIPVAPPWLQDPQPLLFHKHSAASIQSWLQPRIPGVVAPAAAAPIDDDHDLHHASSASSSSTTCWYGVTLDGKMVRTPMGQVLAVPSLHVAHALAVEWDQQARRIQPAQMPLMTLVCTALDQVVTTPHTFQQHSLHYLGTDTVCFYADPTEDRVLYQTQERAWKPIHAHVQAVYKCLPATVMGTHHQTLLATRRTKEQLAAAAAAGNSVGVINGVHPAQESVNGSSIHTPTTTTNTFSSTLGLPHPPHLLEQATSLCHSLDAWHLAALHSVAAEAKSFLVASYMILQHAAAAHHHPQQPHDESEDATTASRQSRRKNRKQLPVVQTAIDAARVEEEFQISNWGLVEGGHDYDRLNCSIRIRAAQVFVQAMALEQQQQQQQQQQYGRS
jgi:ATP synthase F1 complex assembly factor 2